MNLDRVSNFVAVWSAMFLAVAWALEAAFVYPTGLAPRWLTAIIYVGCGINMVCHIWRGRGR